VSQERIEGNKAYGHKSDRQGEGVGGVEERARKDVRSKLRNTAINTERM